MKIMNRVLWGFCVLNVFLGFVGLYYGLSWEDFLNFGAAALCAVVALMHPYNTSKGRNK